MIKRIATLAAMLVVLIASQCYAVQLADDDTRISDKTAKEIVSMLDESTHESIYYFFGPDSSYITGNYTGIATDYNDRVVTLFTINMTKSGYISSVIIEGHNGIQSSTYRVRHRLLNLMGVTDHEIETTDIVDSGLGDSIFRRHVYSNAVGKNIYMSETYGMDRTMIVADTPFYTIEQIVLFQMRN